MTVVTCRECRKNIKTRPNGYHGVFQGKTYKNRTGTGLIGDLYD